MPSLDLEILAVKFRFRSLFKRTIVSLRLHKTYELKIWAFKRLMTGIITEIKIQKENRIQILLHKRRRVFQIWRILTQRRIATKNRVNMIKAWHKEKVMRKVLRTLRNRGVLRKHRRENTKKTKFKAFLALVMNCEGLKQKREQKKNSLLNKCFKAWKPACRRLLEEEQRKFILKRIFGILKFHCANSLAEKYAKAEDFAKSHILAKYFKKLQQQKQINKYRVICRRFRLKKVLKGWIKVFEINKIECEKRKKAIRHYKTGGGFRLVEMCFEVLKNKMMERREKMEKNEISVKNMIEKRNKRIIQKVFQDIHQQALYSRARSFKNFILMQTSIKSLTKNIEISKLEKERSHNNELKVDHMRKRRYFNYLKRYSSQQRKYFIMASKISNFK